MSSNIPQNICRICEKDKKLINITLTECKWIVDKLIDIANVTVCTFVCTFIFLDTKYIFLQFIELIV